MSQVDPLVESDQQHHLPARCFSKAFFFSSDSWPECSLTGLECQTSSWRSTVLFWLRSCGTKKSFCLTVWKFVRKGKYLTVATLSTACSVQNSCSVSLIHYPLCITDLFAKFWPQYFGILSKCPQENGSRCWEVTFGKKIQLNMERKQHSVEVPIMKYMKVVLAPHLLTLSLKYFLLMLLWQQCPRTTC